MFRVALRNYPSFTFSTCSYTKLFKDCQADPSAYWLKEAKNIDWAVFPNTAFTTPQPHFYNWFPQGRLNITTNCLDRHLSAHSNQIAYFMESPITRSSASITYRQLSRRVEALADAMHREFGIKKHDRVVIYMPMIIESVIAMLACARLGAPHVCVFGGFSAQELANRISDCSPSLIICANAGIQPNKVIDYGKIVNEAMEIAKQKQIPKIVCYRPLLPNCPLLSNEYDYRQVEESGGKCGAEVVDSGHPLYILYTSGTTGKPKGIIRDHGGTAVALQHAMRLIYNPKPLETMFCSSDIGWVLGHSFIIYAPLLAAMRSVLFQGKPVGVPDAGVFWEICQRNKVQYLYTSPTAIRSIRKQDPKGEYIGRRDLSKLKNVTTVGQRCDVETYYWMDSHFRDKLVIDCYWQTETGVPILSNFTGVTTFAPKGGSACKPLPGYALTVRNEKGQICKVGQTGVMFLRQPMPPSFMSTILHGADKYIEKYFSTLEGYYNTGDSGYYDEDGYFYVMSRIDDVINTAGHRLSTGEMEEVLMKHPKIAEAVVVGVRDEIKGEVPVGFVTLKADFTLDPLTLQKEAVELVRKYIGPVASFKTCYLVEKLPKTRSGKYLRNIIRKIINKEKYEIPSTAENMDAVYQIQKFIKNIKQ